MVDQMVKPRGIMTGVHLILELELADGVAVANLSRPQDVSQPAEVQAMPADCLVVWTAKAGRARPRPDDHDTTLVGVRRVGVEGENGPPVAVG